MACKLVKSKQAARATDESMDVVRAIEPVESARGDRPLEDVPIEKATVVEV